MLINWFIQARFIVSSRLALCYRIEYYMTPSPPPPPEKNHTQIMYDEIIYS